MRGATVLQCGCPALRGRGESPAHSSSRRLAQAGPKLRPRRPPGLADAPLAHPGHDILGELHEVKRIDADRRTQQLLAAPCQTPRTGPPPPRPLPARRVSVLPARAPIQAQSHPSTTPSTRRVSASPGWSFTTRSAAGRRSRRDRSGPIGSGTHRPEPAHGHVVGVANQVGGGKHGLDQPPRHTGVTVCDQRSAVVLEVGQAWWRRGQCPSRARSLTVSGSSSWARALRYGSTQFQCSFVDAELSCD